MSGRPGELGIQVQVLADDDVHAVVLADEGQTGVREPCPGIGIGPEDLLEARDTAHDVGTQPGGPDGERIAFDSNRDGDSFYDLFVYDIETDELVQLTFETANDVAPAWQP